MKIKFFATIRVASGTSEMVVDIEGQAVRNAIECAIKSCGDKLKEEVLNPDGSIKSHVRVLLNGHFIDRNGDPLAYPISEGDTIFLFPLTAGG